MILTKEFKKTMKEIFITGKTDMGTYWAGFILGLVMGFLVRR